MRLSAWRIIPKIFEYKLFRRFGFPLLLPLNLTISVTNRCNLRCKMCNVWKKEVKEFSFDEFNKTFKSISKSPYWVTISGGEPFLRGDLDKICESIYENLSPQILNIATNGMLYNSIPQVVEKIVQSSPRMEVILNLSLDGVGDKHNKIRNNKDSFNFALRTYQHLRELSYPNFTLGIGTVISKFNLGDFEDILDLIEELRPDSFVCEIAEERVELGTVGEDIAPSPEEYKRVLGLLSSRIKRKKFSGISRLTQALRLVYYDLSKEIILKKKQVIPCYAGFSSAQITPSGEVWACCVKAFSLGDLMKVDYDFKKVWFSEEAELIRKKIKEKVCYCPLANASYTNMLCDFKSLFKVGREFIFINQI
ncbi:MAG: radical SAM protein [Armatimonadetes bacterium CG07_land_8_20_14_0_80_40_9]|nr:MAG: radical SAM protein [Armatimonadetes bacterium CG07_land_8_20_14_0_80_40_9]